MQKEKKIEIDPDVIRTRNLLIWSQTRYRCATESHLFMWVENALHYCCSTFSFVYPLQRKTLALKVRLVVQNTFSIMPLLPTSAVRTTRKASQVMLLRSSNATKIMKCVVMHDLPAVHRWEVFCCGKQRKVCRLPASLWRCTS